LGAPGDLPLEFEEFLAAALPPLGLSPEAHRRRNLRRRLTRRMETLGIHEFRLYLEHLKRTPEEGRVLRSLLPVTISRFFRNRSVFDALSERILPELAARGIACRAWCAGCASGEEAYSLRIAWEELPGKKPPFFVSATDIDPASLSRASEGIYGESSLREVPKGIRGKYFAREGNAFRIREDLKAGMEFRLHDLRDGNPPGKSDLILCRNAAFTYFLPEAQMLAARAFRASLSPSGWLVIGRTEKLPPWATPYFEPVFPAEKIFRFRGEARPGPETAG
jgi:chemotaxis protein methyltransferase CheR